MMHSNFLALGFLKTGRAGTLVLVWLLALLLPGRVRGENWLTYDHDNARDGANTNETVLTPANVNASQFSKLFSYPVDGEVYAEPLYVAKVVIAGQGTHNVLVVATENNTVYALDADSNTGANGGLLWQTNLGLAAVSTNFGVRYHHNLLNPLIGITGTPVIDPVAGTVYVDAFTGLAPDTTNCLHVLHALKLTDGTEQPYSPVVVAASVPGIGVDSSNGVVAFGVNRHDSRPALTLAGGVLYAAFGSFGDTDPYHGWVIGFNATNLVQITNYVFASTPNARTNDFGVNAGEGALWMGGNGLCVDANTNLYFETANGSFSANTNGGDYGDSFVKLSTDGRLAVADYFSPSNQESMAVNDLDLGSGGPMLLPDAAGSAAHPHLMVGAGKEGTIYLVDRDNLGHFSATANNIVQTLVGVMGGSFGVPAYFNHWIYYQNQSDVMKAFAITNGVITPTPVSKSSATFGDIGFTTVISANGTSNAIAWVVQTDGYNNGSPVSSAPAILHAFNATNLSQELYNSSQNPTRDNPGGAMKYTVPTVVNGKVYVAAEYAVSVFGTGVILPPPVIAPNGGFYTNSVVVTLTDATNTTTIYYTLDGTTPTTNSTLYTGPITLTNTALLTAIAALPGAYNSAVASASFVNSASIGTGTGLLGSYYANTTAAAFTNGIFTNLPALVQTDATINFNYGGAGPSPAVGKSNYVVRWTGTIQPQFSGPYTFFLSADDGARLYLNGRLVINDWINQISAVASNTIPLTAQQLYNVELDYYYQNDNGGQIALAWSSPAMPETIVPASQLYPYTNLPPAVVLESPANGAQYTGTASVSIDVEADDLYNSVSTVNIFANGNLLGSLTNSAEAPLYQLTATGFLPNPGGETANSAPVSATPTGATALITTNVEAAGTDWTAAIWKTNGTGTAVAPVAGNAYGAVFNGTGIGNNLNNTRIRSPVASGTVTFAGASLTLNTNTEVRLKGSSPITNNFPGVGGNAGLILNGGMLNEGTASTVPVITGSIQVNSLSYDSAQGVNGGGGGLAPDSRAITIAGYLSGSGGLVIMNCSTNLPQIISGPTNSFSGTWIVQCGWLQGAVANSLGTSSSVLVDPNYTGYLAAMPNATSPAGPAIFEPNYNLYTYGTLTLTNGGKMNLHQNCFFYAITIEGTRLGYGTHTYAELSANYPNNFLPGGSGSLNVELPPPGPPNPATVPSGLTALSGNAQVSLSWSASSGATDYNVKRSTTNGGPYTLLATVTNTSYTDTHAANGTTYYYVVSAQSAPGYTLTAVVTDGSGLSSTSAPVQILVNADSGLPYGLTTNGTMAPFLNMPAVIPAVLPGSLPLLLSQTGVFADTPSRTPAGGLIPYSPNTPLWSDGALKSRYLAVPGSGGLIMPDEQIAFEPTNSWTFPAGTVFVKNFDLVVNATNANVAPRRLETRLLVRDAAGAVYGVTYKWRADNSDADLLLTSSNEVILITNATGITPQTWYYPSPADCLTCHTPAANYVLGVNTRQLNCSLTYPTTGNTDNQLRTLNRLGLFNPAIDSGGITNYAQMVALTNQNASLEQRSRSYLDANCAQCHLPGGQGITFDARYDTPLAQQNITNYPAQLTLGIDHPCIVKAEDVWRSLALVRVKSLDPNVQMPPLARNLVDTNAVQVITAWINSLPGTPALAPPVIAPGGGRFIPAVTVVLQGPDTNATLYYTMDGTLPTTNSTIYAGPIRLTNSVTLTVNAFETNYNNSIAASAVFVVAPGGTFTTSGFAPNGIFQMGFASVPGSNYVLQATTNFINWVTLSTNLPTNGVFNLFDPQASNFPARFYRVLGPVPVTP